MKKLESSKSDTIRPTNRMYVRLSTLASCAAARPFELGVDDRRVRSAVVEDLWGEYFSGYGSEVPEGCLDTHSLKIAWLTGTTGMALFSTRQTSIKLERLFRTRDQFGKSRSKVSQKKSSLLHFAQPFTAPRKVRHQCPLFLNFSSVDDDSAMPVVRSRKL